MSLDDFFDAKENKAETERRNRIRLSIAAYAYEFQNKPIMSDADYDKLSLIINLEQTTIEEYHIPEQRARYEILDAFFRTEFIPDTGQWIYKHPELERLEYVFQKIFRNKS